jgi:hypothetical protein
MKCIALAFIGLLFAACSCLAQVPTTGAGNGAPGGGGGFGSPTLILAQNTTQASGTATSGVSAAAPAGSLVVLAVGVGSGGSGATLVDSAGNSYTQALRSVHSGVEVELWYNLSLGTQLPSSGTFTATTNGDVYYVVGAVYVSGGAAALDKTLDATSTGTGFSEGLTGLATSADIVFGTFNYNSADISVWTEGSGWTTIVSPLTNPSIALPFSYIKASSSTSATWAPSFTPTSTQAIALAAFHK